MHGVIAKLHVSTKQPKTKQDDWTPQPIVQQLKLQLHLTHVLVITILIKFLLLLVVRHLLLVAMHLFLVKK